jgi:hypothetical protein
MRAAPTEEMRIFLSTQIADEARHVRFFERFYDEVGVLEGSNGIADRLATTKAHVNDSFVELFDGMLKERVDRLANEPALKAYHLLPSVRGDLLEKLGRFAEARAEFERAASLTRNARERRLLIDRAAKCAGTPNDVR